MNFKLLLLHSELLIWFSVKKFTNLEHSYCSLEIFHLKLFHFKNYFMGVCTHENILLLSTHIVLSKQSLFYHIEDDKKEPIEAR